MRFNIRIDAIWRAPLLLAGATPQNCYVFLGEDGMHFRFGLLFNRTVPYDQVTAVRTRSWPLLLGVGARSDFRGVIGLTGSYHDVVEVSFKERLRNWAGVFPVDRIAVSMEEPEAFIGELAERSALAGPNGNTPRPEPTKTSPAGATPGAATQGRGEARPPSTPSRVGATRGAATGGRGEARPRNARSRKTPTQKTPPASAKANGARAAAAPAKAAKTVAKKAAATPRKNGAKPAKKAPAASAKANVAKAPSRKPAARKRPPAAARRPARPRRSRSS
jgi:DNA-binding protein HU-beta